MKITKIIGYCITDYISHVREYRETELEAEAFAHFLAENAILDFRSYLRSIAIDPIEVP